MIIHNRITNNLKIVEKVNLLGPLDLFMRSFSASTGFVLEVFRSGRHLSSITPANTGRGDLHTLSLASHALQVNLGPRIMEMSGHLLTQDGFTREYKIELRIHISDSTQFATLYTQNSDPAALAQKAIESILTNYSQNKRHDEITSAAIMELGRSSFSTATRQCSGITVDEILHVNVGLDPGHQQVTNIHRQASITEAQLDAQAPLEQKRTAYTLQIERIIAEHKIQLSSLEHLHELEMDQKKREHLRRQLIQDTYTTGLSQVIANHLNSGFTLQELWELYPDLRSILQSSMEPQGLLPQVSNIEESTVRALDIPNALPPPTTNNQANVQSNMHVRERRRINEQGESEVIELQASSTPGSEVVYEPIIKIRQRRDGEGNLSEYATLPDPPLAPTIAVTPVTNESEMLPNEPIMGSTYHNDRLGVTLVMITKEEHRVLELDSQIALSVQSVDVGSPAHRASIIRSDFLVEINHQPVIDIQSLLLRLEECTDNTMLAIRVLRHGQLLNLPEVPMKKEEPV